ncbi:MAG: sn-glycerol-3-phosphate ABC transporter ATP-binding protein UgpC [Brachymonas sp.]|nr:sn-glycerol-3-phosphate ABC transporter ATP-binding protein UgpC [Brachymonas sp.]
MSSLSLTNIAKQYPGANSYTIENLNCNYDGEFMVFVGPSGCGKTTLLRMISGLEDITDGEIAFGDSVVNDLSPAQRGSAMVFQSYALYPHMTVAENMGFALKMAGASKAEQQAAVKQAAETLQITQLLDRKPKALSGGQRQRVAIGRAIVRKPKVFLFDEPLSNLDANLRVQMRVELSRLHQELGTTMIYVTHDQVEAMTLGQRIAVFNHGKIEQVGTPLDLYHRPANLFVAEFMGSPKMNLLPAKTPADAQAKMIQILDAGSLALPAGVDATKVRTVGIRPEAISIVEKDQGLSCQINLIEQLGDSTIVYGQLTGSDKDISVRLVGSSSHLALGQTIDLGCQPKDMLLFDADGRAIAV